MAYPKPHILQGPGPSRSLEFKLTTHFLFFTAFYKDKITMCYNFHNQPEQFDICWPWVQFLETQRRKTLSNISMYNLSE